MALVFHRLVQKDLAAILAYYETEAGRALADRFFEEFEALMAKVEAHPGKFRTVSADLRRANMPCFPYHVLFRRTPDEIRVLVVRHHKRRPNLGVWRR